MTDITSTAPDTLSPNWNEQGLIAAIAQDADTGEVVMLSWMKAEALEQTRPSGMVPCRCRARERRCGKGCSAGRS